MKRPTLTTGLILLFGIIYFSPTVASYDLAGYQWRTATTTFNVDIRGANGLWNTAFEDAMGFWSQDTVFDFQIRRATFEDPCDFTTCSLTACLTTCMGMRKARLFRGGVCGKPVENWQESHKPVGTVDLRASDDQGHTGIPVLLQGSVVEGGGLPTKGRLRSSVQLHQRASVRYVACLIHV